MWPQVREVMDPIKSQISGPENTAPNLQFYSWKQRAQSADVCLRSYYNSPPSTPGSLGYRTPSSPSGPRPQKCWTVEDVAQNGPAPGAERFRTSQLCASP